MPRSALLVLVAALPLLAATCGTPPDAAATAAPGTPGAAASDTLSIRTDSLVVSVDSLNYTVNISYPQLGGSSATVPAAMVARVNAAIRDSVAANAEQFRPTEAPPPDERDSPSYVAEVEGGMFNERLHGDVFSALLSVYAFTGGAHGNTFYVPLTYDLRTGAAISLGDAFQPGTPWADTLSAHAGRALVAKMREGDPDATAASMDDSFYPEGFNPDAMRDVRFSLGADSLMVHFAPYEVAYYAFGTTDVPVAYTALESFLKPDGPIARIRTAR